MGRKIFAKDLAAFDHVWLVPSGGIGEQLTTVTAIGGPDLNGRLTVWGVFTGTRTPTRAQVPADGTVTIEEN